jgi:hypothetical protein
MIIIDYLSLEAFMPDNQKSSAKTSQRQAHGLERQTTSRRFVQEKTRFVSRTFTKRKQPQSKTDASYSTHSEAHPPYATIKKSSANELSSITNAIEKMEFNENTLTHDEIIQHCDTIKCLLKKLSDLLTPSSAHLQIQTEKHEKLSELLEYFIEPLSTVRRLNPQLIQAIDSTKSALYRNQQEIENLSIRLKKADFLDKKYFSEEGIFSSTGKNLCSSTVSSASPLIIFSRFSASTSAPLLWSLALLQQDFITLYTTDPLELEERIEKAKQSYRAIPEIFKALEQLYAEVINSQALVDVPTASFVTPSH